MKGPVIMYIWLGTAVLVIFAISSLNSTGSVVKTCSELGVLLPDDCSCSDVTHTLWYVAYSGIRLVCPQLEFEYYPNNVTIKCHENQKDLKLSALFKLNVGPVTRLTIKDCPFTGWSFRDITDHFNITHVYDFQLQDRISTLNKTLFCNLTDIFMIEMIDIGLESIVNDPFECAEHDMNSNGHSIIQLEIKGNNIKNLSDDAFKSLKRISIINLMRNNITHVPEHLFSYNSALEGLDLSFNQLSSLPINLFANLTNLTRLDLQGNQLIEIPSELLAPLKNLEVLDLGGNLIKRLGHGEYIYLDKLVYLNLQNNQLTSLDGPQAGVFTLRRCVDLKHLRLNGNKMSRMYEDWTWFTQLEKLNLSYNQFTQLQVSDFGFRSNILVDLSHNLITEINITSTSVSKDKRSKTCVVLLHDNPLSCDCKLQPFVQSLQTTQNKLQVPHAKISPLVSRTTVVHFRDVQSLRCSSPDSSLLTEAVELLACKISDRNYTCPSECSCLYRLNDRANIVDCVNVGLKEVPLLLSVYNKANHTILNLQENPLKLFAFHEDVSSAGFISNITVLNLTNTALTDFGVSPFYKNIKVLDLSHNKLTTLSGEALSVISGMDLVVLHDNPWRCHCDNLHMITEVTKSEKVGLINEVKCRNGTALSELKLDDLCLPWYSSFTVAVCSLLGGLLLILTVALCYFVNYCYSRSQVLRSKTQNLDVIDKNKKYDAFISFTDKDLGFVSDVLVPRLDSCYKLCLRYRDWSVSEPIPKQIITSIQKSRRTIVVLSPDYLSNSGSVLEFSVALAEAKRDKVSRLVVIKYKDVTGEPRIASEIGDVIRMKTYITWEDNSNFWNNIFNLMPNPPKDNEKIKITLPSFLSKSNSRPKLDIADSLNMKSLPQPSKNTEPLHVGPNGK